MKNILFATTALVATAGIASADVEPSLVQLNACVFRTEKVQAKAAALIAGSKLLTFADPAAIAEDAGGNFDATAVEGAAADADDVAGASHCRN